MYGGCVLSPHGLLSLPIQGYIGRMKISVQLCLFAIYAIKDRGEKIVFDIP